MCRCITTVTVCQRITKYGNPDAFFKTTVVPVILMLVVNLIVIVCMMQDSKPASIGYRNVFNKCH